MSETRLRVRVVDESAPGLEMIAGDSQRLRRKLPNEAPELVAIVQFGERACALGLGSHGHLFSRPQAWDLAQELPQQRRDLLVLNSYLVVRHVPPLCVGHAVIVTPAVASHGPIRSLIARRRGLSDEAKIGLQVQT